MQMSCWEWSNSGGRPGLARRGPATWYFSRIRATTSLLFHSLFQFLRRFSRRVQYPRSGFAVIMIHDRRLSSPPPRFPVTHPRIPRGGIRNYAIRILTFLESRILGTQPLRLPLEYFYIFGTVPVDRNIRNFLQECKIKRIRWNFASQIFSTGFIYRASDRCILIWKIYSSEISLQYPFVIANCRLGLYPDDSLVNSIFLARSARWSRITIYLANEEEGARSIVPLLLSTFIAMKNK